MPEATPPVNPFKKASAAARRAGTFSIIAIILAILAGAAAWLTWQQTRQTTQTVKSYVNELSQQATASLQSEQDKLVKLQNQINALHSKFDKVQNQLDQLDHVSAKARQQRALSETSYLIHMANLQLTISRNTDAALQLMRLADEQLKMIPNDSISELKSAITKDITALENTPTINVAKLLTQFSQLKVSVLKLPGMPTQPVTTMQPSDTQKNDIKLPWYKKLGKAFSGLKDLVIIRHNKKPIKPLLSPQQLIFLKQNVQLKISEAEWAVLYQNSAVYQQSLNSAKQMLETYYPNESAMAETLKQITELSEININPKLPDLSNTLSILNQTKLVHKPLNHAITAQKHDVSGLRNL